MACLTPFNLDIPEDTIATIKARVASYPWHEMPDDGGWDYGVNLDYMKEICAYWVEEFDKREDPTGKEYYWLTGKFINEDKGEDTDEWALENGYVSVVPVHFDMTAHHSIQKLNTWDF